MSFTLPPFSSTTSWQASRTGKPKNTLTSYLSGPSKDVFFLAINVKQKCLKKIIKKNRQHQETHRANRASILSLPGGAWNNAFNWQRGKPGWITTNLRNPAFTSLSTSRPDTVSLRFGAKSPKEQFVSSMSKMAADKSKGAPYEGKDKKSRTTKALEALSQFNGSAVLNDDNGWTALHYAAWADSLEVVQELMNGGASADVLDRNGNRPADFTADARTLSLITPTLPPLY